MSAAQPCREGLLEFGEYKTWYRVTGSLDNGTSATPLICVHGGPGACSDYMWIVGQLATTSNIPVVAYDQLGNGRSTRLPERMGDGAFWNVALFKQELANLIDRLGLRETGYHLLGHSWGGMLCAAYACDRPVGLRKLVISNSPASIPLWLESCNKLRDALPAEIQATLVKHEDAETTDSPEYKGAVDVFNKRHLCRVVPFPGPVQAMMDWIEEDPTVYHTMNGPSEFHVIGTLKTWSIIEQLDRIEAPVLILSGEHDEAQPVCVAPFADKIKDSKWVVLEGASHLAMHEVPERYLHEVAQFLKS